MTRLWPMDKTPAPTSPDEQSFSRSCRTMVSGVNDTIFNAISKRSECGKKRLVSLALSFWIRIVLVGANHLPRLRVTSYDMLANQRAPPFELRDIFYQHVLDDQCFAPPENHPRRCTRLIFDWTAPSG